MRPGLVPGPCIRNEANFETGARVRLRARGQNSPDTWARPELTLWTGPGCRYRARGYAVFPNGKFIGRTELRWVISGIRGRYPRPRDNQSARVASEDGRADTAV